MGTWRTEHFDNDMAMDWIYDFSLAPTVDTLRDSFRQVINNQEYIDGDEGAIVLAAAEVIAAAKGNIGNSWPEDIPVFTDLPITDELVANALLAIEKVTADNSELKELWEKNDQYDTWLAAVDDLKSRLQ